jgi:hypothetical protein
LSSVDSSVAATRNSFPVFSRPLMLGMLLTGLVLAVQQIQFLPHNVGSHTASFSRLIRLTPPPAPSPYQQEAAMGPRALLDRWNPLVQEAAQKFNIPAAWIRAVMRRESGGRTMLAEDLPIVSNAGAMGIMQMMPATYGQMAKQHRLGNDPFNPRDNIMAGTAYLRWLHQRYGFPAMFAAYNNGPGNYDQHLRGRARLPAETRNYLKAISQELGAVRLAKATLTRPDGRKIAIEVARVRSLRAALPGEFAPSVRTVIAIGRQQQGVREDLALAATRLRALGAPV